MGTLTKLALVAQEVSRAATGGLISSTDGAVASIPAVILACVQVAGGSCESSRAPAGRRACGRTGVVR